MVLKAGYGNLVQAVDAVNLNAAQDPLHPVGYPEVPADAVTAHLHVTLGAGDLRVDMGRAFLYRPNLMYVIQMLL